MTKKKIVKKNESELFEPDPPREYIMNIDRILTYSNDGARAGFTFGIIFSLITIMGTICLFSKHILLAFGLLIYIIIGTEIASYFVVKYYTKGRNYTKINKNGIITLKLISVFWCIFANFVVAVIGVIIFLIIVLIKKLIIYINLNFITFAYYFLGILLILIIILLVVELNYKRFNKQLEKQNEKDQKEHE